MNSKEFKKLYWKNFKSIEFEFLDCSKFVAIDRINYACYSDAFLKLILQIGSEVDVVLQLLCNILDGDSNASKIDQYKEIILKHQPEFEQVTVVSDEFGISEIPWKGWSTSSPIWWRLYNKIKHDRLGIDNGILKTGLAYYKEANLQNILASLMALYQVETYIYNHLMLKDGEMEVYTYKSSNLFALDGFQWDKESFHKEGEIIFKDENCYIPTDFRN